MANLGIVTPVARGDWDSGLTYNVLNIVKYNNATYMAKSTSIGVPPSSSASAWMKLVDNQTPPASSTKAISEFVILASNENPHNLFGGEWLQIKETFLFGASDITFANPTYEGGDTGGSKDAVVISHNHYQDQFIHGPAIASWEGNNVELGGVRRVRWPVEYASFAYETDTGTWTYTPNFGDYTNITGEDGTGKNMPPYLVVYIWQRIA